MGVSGADGQVDAYVDSLDDLVVALRQDPVNVQQVRGNGHTAEVDAVLTQIVASSEVPIYVALVGDLPELAVDDPAGDLEVRLQTKLDPQAVYVVAVGDTRTSFHYAGNDPELEDAIYEGLSPIYRERADRDGPRASDAGEAAIIASVVAADDHTLSADLVDTYTASQTWTRQGYADDFDDPYLHAEVTAAATLVGLFVALVGWRLTRTWVLRAVTAAPPPEKKRDRRRERPSTSRAPAVAVAGGPDLEDVRRDATAALDKLARDLTDRPSGPGVEDALGCRVAAESVIGSDDLLDVVGALVLARSGRRRLNEPDRPYRPCFLNPLHGGGAAETEVPVRGGRSVSVPVCSQCRRAATSGRTGEPLLARPVGWPLRGRRPYYEGNTVWARTGFGSLDPDFWRRVTEVPR